MTDLQLKEAKEVAQALEHCMMIENDFLCETCPLGGDKNRYKSCRVDERSFAILKQLIAEYDGDKQQMRKDIIEEIIDNLSKNMM